MDSFSMEIIATQMRRARWYDYIRRRFDLVSFGDLADWIATIPGGVDRNEARRTQALLDFKQSIARGEFGARDKRCIPWLPKPPRTDMIGRLCIRLNYGQIVGMGDTVIADLWATSALCQKWLEARQIALPPWLTPPVDRPLVAEPLKIEPEQPKVTFDYQKAKWILAGIKKSGHLIDPGRDEVQAELSRIYIRVSRKNAENLLWEVWGRTQINRRKTAKTAKKIQKN
jgi:hypothetical protein